VACEENETVVDFALKNRSVKLVEMGLEIGEPGLTRFKKVDFDETMERSRRIYPHLLENFDGFYIAKFKKYSDKSDKS
jgi:25S rRNA (cytosine2870-C5)-methyltransferase